MRLNSLAKTRLLSAMFCSAFFLLATLCDNATAQETNGSSFPSAMTSTKQNPGMSDMGWSNEKIRQALNQPINLIYDETPWSDVEAELEAKLDFNIVLDQSAKDDSLTEAEPLVCDLKGIPLKSALRIALRGKNATFLIRNGVLLIISLDDAEDVVYFEHSFINVRPLLAQIRILEKDRIGKPRIRRGTQASHAPHGVSGGGVFGVAEQEALQGISDSANSEPANDNQDPKPVAPAQPVELVTAESMLMDLIKSSVQNEAWMDSGQGLATIEIIGGYVVLNTTAEMTDELRDFLKDLNFHLSLN